MKEGSVHSFMNDKDDQHVMSSPEDSEKKKIVAYLRAHGELRLTDRAIVWLYACFSQERYALEWMSVDDARAAEFVEWLKWLNKKGD